MNYILDLIISLIYKEKCLICGCSKDNKILCKNCLKDVEILSGFAQSKIEGVEIYSATLYKGIIKKLIHGLKFNHKIGAARVLAEICAKYFNKINFSDNFLKNVVVVPVPTSKKNIKNRGYNNVLKIAEIFARLEKLDFDPDFILKIKNNKPQFKLNKNKRKTNVEGVFRVNLKKVEKYKQKTVIVMDDIITTGVTLREIIRILHKNGIKNILCFTVSKTPI